MAGGGQVWLTDSKRDPNGARVVNGRLLVSSDGGGGGGGGDVNIAEVGGVAVGGSSVPVSIVTPTQFDVTGSSVVISGSVSLNPGIAEDNLGKRFDDPSTANPVGVLATAITSGVGVRVTSSDGDYSNLITNSFGRLWVTWDGMSIDTVGAINKITPGTSKTDLGKAEDDPHVSGDTGVAALAMRQDTLASSVSNDGDYATIKVDSLGALWVRMAGMTTIALSGSTRGRPIQITATASAGTLLHTATTTAGQIDKVFIDLTNTSASAVTVTIEFGTTGAGAEMDIVVPANATVRAVDGAVLGGAATDTIRAFASVGSVVNAVGRVERLS